jgi:hypothetical protein
MVMLVLLVVLSTQMAWGRRSRSTTTLQFAPLVWSHAWEGDVDNVRSEVVSVKRGRGRSSRVLCSGFTTLHTSVGGAGICFFLVPTGSLYLNKSKSKDHWLRGFKSSESKNRRVRECLNHFKEPSSLVKQPAKNRRLHLGIWFFFFLSLRIMMIYIIITRSFEFLITMIINFDTQIDTRK